MSWKKTTCIELRNGVHFRESKKEEKERKQQFQHRLVPLGTFPLRKTSLMALSQDDTAKGEETAPQIENGQVNGSAQRDSSRPKGDSLFSIPSQLKTRFFNQCFDKGRLKNLILWFSSTYGEKKTIDLVEKLKTIGFSYASKAGISLGIDDLKVPPSKYSLIFFAEKETSNTVNQYKRGEITGVERFQRLIDTWHRTSENLKQEVIHHFEATDVLNPVYMMAFSGARGNISQVRQLVGMRGLMADPQGQILDFPIRSNFKEGLTLTEYIISSYGARKGIVDTALRTANAGYLTRRLVDVAQHVIISNFDCGTRRGIFLKDMKEGNKTIHSLTQRLVGRILARDLILNENLLNNEDKDKKTEKKGIVPRNTEMTFSLAFSIGKKYKKVFVRSPLTCETRPEGQGRVCQFCYGWSLAQGSTLVSIGEAVGVIAAQSIGEPGTQLTMRTFHTGGVFAGDISDQIRAPFDGIVYYTNPIPGTLIRTSEGKIAFLTKEEGSFLLAPISELEGASEEKRQELKKSSNAKFKIPSSTLLYIRNGQKVVQKEVIAQISSISKKSNATDDAEFIIKSSFSGQFYSKSLGGSIRETFIGPVCSTRENDGWGGSRFATITENLEYQKKSDFTRLSPDKKASSLSRSQLPTKQTDPKREKVYSAWTWGYAWILSGKIYALNYPGETFFPILGDSVQLFSQMNQSNWNINVNCSTFSVSYTKQFPHPAMSRKDLNHLTKNPLEEKRPYRLSRGIQFRGSNESAFAGDTEGKNQNHSFNQELLNRNPEKTNGDIAALQNILFLSISNIISLKYGYILKLPSLSTSLKEVPTGRVREYRKERKNAFIPFRQNLSLKAEEARRTSAAFDILFFSTGSTQYGNDGLEPTKSTSVSQEKGLQLTNNQPILQLQWFPYRYQTTTGGLFLFEPSYSTFRPSPVWKESTKTRFKESPAGAHDLTPKNTIGVGSGVVKINRKRNTANNRKSILSEKEKQKFPFVNEWGTKMTTLARISESSEGSILKAHPIQSISSSIKTSLVKELIFTTFEKMNESTGFVSTQHKKGSNKYSILKKKRVEEMKKEKSLVELGGAASISYKYNPVKKVEYLRETSSRKEVNYVGGSFFNINLGSFGMRWKNGYKISNQEVLLDPTSLTHSEKTRELTINKQLMNNQKNRVFWVPTLYYPKGGLVTSSLDYSSFSQTKKRKAPTGKQLLKTKPEQSYRISQGPTTRQLIDTKSRLPKREKYYSSFYFSIFSLFSTTKLREKNSYYSTKRDLIAKPLSQKTPIFLSIPLFLQVNRQGSFSFVYSSYSLPNLVFGTISKVKSFISSPPIHQSTKLTPDKELRKFPKGSQLRKLKSDFALFYGKGKSLKPKGEISSSSLGHVGGSREATIAGLTTETEGMKKESLFQFLEHTNKKLGYQRIMEKTSEKMERVAKQKKPAESRGEAAGLGTCLRSSLSRVATRKIRGINQNIPKESLHSFCKIFSTLSLRSGTLNKLNTESNYTNHLATLRNNAKSEALKSKMVKKEKTKEIKNFLIENAFCLKDETSKTRESIYSSLYSVVSPFIKQQHKAINQTEKQTVSSLRLNQTLFPVYMYLRNLDSSPLQVTKEKGTTVPKALQASSHPWSLPLYPFWEHRTGTGNKPHSLNQSIFKLQFGNKPLVFFIQNDCTIPFSGYSKMNQGKQNDALTLKANPIRVGGVASKNLKEFKKTYTKGSLCNFAPIPTCVNGTAPSGYDSFSNQQPNTTLQQLKNVQLKKGWVYVPLHFSFVPTGQASRKNNKVDNKENNGRDSLRESQVEKPVSPNKVDFVTKKSNAIVTSFPFLNYNKQFIYPGMGTVKSLKGGTFPSMNNEQQERQRELEKLFLNKKSDRTKLEKGSINIGFDAPVPVYSSLLFINEIFSIRNIKPFSNWVKRNNSRFYSTLKNERLQIPTGGISGSKENETLALFFQPVMEFTKMSKNELRTYSSNQLGKGTTNTVRHFSFSLDLPSKYGYFKEFRYSLSNTGLGRVLQQRSSYSAEVKSNGLLSIRFALQFGKQLKYNTNTTLLRNGVVNPSGDSLVKWKNFRKSIYNKQKSTSQPLAKYPSSETRIFSLSYLNKTKGGPQKRQVPDGTRMTNLKKQNKRKLQVPKGTRHSLTQALRKRQIPSPYRGLVTQFQPILSKKPICVAPFVVSSSVPPLGLDTYFKNQNYFLSNPPLLKMDRKLYPYLSATLLDLLQSYKKENSLKENRTNEKQQRTETSRLQNGNGSREATPLRNSSFSLFSLIPNLFETPCLAFNNSFHIETSVFKNRTSEKTKESFKDKKVLFSYLSKPNFNDNGINASFLAKTTSYSPFNGEIVSLHKKHNKSCMVLTKESLCSYYFSKTFTEMSTDKMKNAIEKSTLTWPLSSSRFAKRVTLENSEKFPFYSGRPLQGPKTNIKSQIEKSSPNQPTQYSIDNVVIKLLNMTNLKVSLDQASIRPSAVLSSNETTANSLREETDSGFVKVSSLSAGTPTKSILTKQNGFLLGNRLGDFFVYGDQISPTTAINTSGQLIHFNLNKMTLRRAQPIFISPKGILHKFDNDYIDPSTQAPVITLFYQRLKTGDIVQGIPKVEQFFEARTTKRGRFFRESMPYLLKSLFKRYRSRLRPDLAVRQSYYKIQQILVDGVQRVYKSQGVTIADKHLEIIVKQMTSKVRIIDGSQTGFFPGEVVDLCFVEKLNKLLMKKIKYEPLVLGITKSSLATNSFLSAASFQQTTRVLSQAALYRKKDFLRGLKENIILGNLIPAGTGFLVYIDPSSHHSSHQ